MANSPLSSPHKFAPTPQNVEKFVPTGSNWSAYWLFISASAIIMLVLYLAVNGQLATWFSLFSFNGAINSVASSQTSTTTVAQEVAGGSSVLTGSAAAQAGVQAGQSFYNSFLSFLGFGPTQASGGGTSSSSSAGTPSTGTSSTVGGSSTTQTPGS